MRLFTLNEAAFVVHNLIKINARCIFVDRCCMQLWDSEKLFANRRRPNKLIPALECKTAGKTEKQLRAARDGELKNAGGTHQERGINVKEANTGINLVRRRAGESKVRE